MYEVFSAGLDFIIIGNRNEKNSKNPDNGKKKSPHPEEHMVAVKESARVISM
jgi:hypothetical protein